MHKKIEVAYIVPDCGEFGGIQVLANETAQMFDGGASQYLITEYGWYFKDIPLLIRGLLRYSPSYLGRQIYRIMITPYFNRKLNFKGDVYHYWNLDCSLPYNHKPYVVSVHGQELLSKNHRGFRRNAYANALNNASAIHVNSAYTKKLLLGTFPAIDSDKIVIINPATPKNSYVIKEHDKNKNKYVVGTLTRFVGRKNVPNVVKALTILKNKYKVNFIYYLAGDGPKRKRIMSELAKSGIEYKYFGKISNKDKIQKFYPALDVFVLPPLQTKKDVEGFGIVFLEANASGVPVVAADTGGVSDAVQLNVSGLFADPTNPDDIAEKIYKILNSERDYRKSVRNWAENFSQKKASTQFRELYGKVKEQ